MWSATMSSNEISRPHSSHRPRHRSYNSIRSDRERSVRGCSSLAISSALPPAPDGNRVDNTGQQHLTASSTSIAARHWAFPNRARHRPRRSRLRSTSPASCTAGGVSERNLTRREVFKQVSSESQIPAFVRGYLWSFGAQSRVVHCCRSQWFSMHPSARSTASKVVRQTTNKVIRDPPARAWLAAPCSPADQ